MGLITGRNSQCFQDKCALLRNTPTLSFLFKTHNNFSNSQHYSMILCRVLSYMVAESTFTAIKIKAMQLPKIDYEESKTKSHATSETTIFYGSKLDSRPFVPSEHFSESQTMPCQWKLVCVLDFNEILSKKKGR